MSDGFITVSSETSDNSDMSENSEEVFSEQEEEIDFIIKEKEDAEMEAMEISNEIEELLEVLEQMDEEYDEDSKKLDEEKTEKLKLELNNLDLELNKNMEEYKELLQLGKIMTPEAKEIVKKHIQKQKNIDSILTNLESVENLIEQENAIQLERKMTIQQQQLSLENEISELKKQHRSYKHQIKKINKISSKYNLDNVNLEEVQYSLKINQQKELKLRKLLKKQMGLTSGQTESEIQFQGKNQYEDEIDRSEWIEKTFKHHPKLQNLLTRVNPLERAIQFGYRCSHNKTFVNRSLSKSVLNKLIIQHFHYIGRRDLANFLSNKFSISLDIEEINIPKSQLVFLIRKAVSDTDSIWNLLNEPTNISKSDLIEILTDHFEKIEIDLKNPDDVGIWEQGIDSKENIRYDGEGSFLSSILCANVNKLIEKATDPKTDSTYVSAFLMTYRSFTQPKFLFNKLIDRFNVPPDNKIIINHIWPKLQFPEEFKEDTRKKIADNSEFLQKYEDEYSIYSKIIQLKTINVIEKWVRDGFSDFEENPKLLESLKLFIDSTLSEKFSMSANNISRLIEDKLSKRQISVLRMTQEVLKPLVPPNIFLPTLTLNDVPELEFSRQWTLQSADMYNKILPSELVTEAWSKPKLKHKAPNLLHMIHKFNEMAGWIATQIVMIEGAKGRGKQLDRFLTICKHCDEMDNFNAVMCIVGALTNPSIKRLTYSWEFCKKSSLLEDFKTLMATSSGYKHYRERLDKTTGPRVPYIGVFLTDIVQISAGMDNYINGLVNMRKMKLLSETVFLIQNHQKLPYMFDRIYQIQKHFDNELKHLPDKELYKISLKREPRKAKREDIIL